MSHRRFVSMLVSVPGTTSSVALPKPTWIIAVKRRAPSPSYLESSACYHPCPLRRQEVKILAYADGLRQSNTTTRVQCPSLEFKIYCLTTEHRHVGVLNVGCFGFSFSFCTTAGVDVNVEQVSERVLRSRPSPSPATIQLLHKSTAQGQSLQIIHHGHLKDGVYPTVAESHKVEFPPREVTCPGFGSPGSDYP